MSDKKVELRFYVSRRLANQLYLLGLDPMYLRPRYSWMSKLGERLLEKWVHDVQKGKETIT